MAHSLALDRNRASAALVPAQVPDPAQGRALVALAPVLVQVLVLAQALDLGLVPVAASSRRLPAGPISCASAPSARPLPTVRRIPLRQARSMRTHG